MFRTTVPQPVRDLVVLAARIGLGVVFIAHGVQKFQDVGGTQQGFDGMGVPLPEVSAVLAAGIETGAGALLLLGALTPVAAVLLAAVMAGAFTIVHVSNGLFVGDGGYELVLVLGLGALMVGAVGPGRFSVDHLLGGRRRGDRAADGAGTTARSSSTDAAARS